MKRMVVCPACRTEYRSDLWERCPLCEGPEVAEGALVRVQKLRRAIEDIASAAVMDERLDPERWRGIGSEEFSAALAVAYVNVARTAIAEAVATGTMTRAFARGLVDAICDAWAADMEKLGGRRS